MLAAGFAEKNLKLIKGGIEFQARLNRCMAFNLNLRSPLRILMRVGNFKADSFEKLEKKIESIDWILYLPQNCSLEFNVTSKKSRLYHSDAIAQRCEKIIFNQLKTEIGFTARNKSRATILADPVQVHQIVMNICTNAYHAMRDSGGVLMIELSEIEITLSEIASENSCASGRYLKLEVKDTGHGMSKETLEKIFDPYFSTKKADQGTGLGLAVVNGIIKKQKGFIRAYSEINQGSSFQIFWPVIEKQEPLKSNAMEKTDLIQGSGHIMVLDDEDDILEISQVMLEKQGYQVSAFKDGISALDAFNKDPGLFDLIVTDMAMPKMTGAEFSVKILDIRKDIPIVLCTGYSDNFDAEMAHEIGIKQYVQKPVIWQDLSAHIRELLDKN